MFDLDKLLRDNIKKLKPYSSARAEYKGKDAVFLDANENPFNAPYNRYPDPLHLELKQFIGCLKGIYPDQIFLGNGSDEAIDLILRIFCNPGKDNIVTIDPTYGMYQVCADINDVMVIRVPLLENFDFPVQGILQSITKETKVIFMCSPNNPTSNAFKKEDMLKVIEGFDGIVVIDEAYIDFAPGKSLLPVLTNHPNLIILQTFSKAWGLAGVRLGMAFASKEIIGFLNKIKYPYNVNILTAQLVLEKIKFPDQKDKWVKALLDNRENLKDDLSQLPLIRNIYHSDANFLLVKIDEPRKIYEYLVNKKIVVRDRSKVTLCEGCLRITVGAPSENSALIEALKDYEK